MEKSAVGIDNFSTGKIFFFNFKNKRYKAKVIKYDAQSDKLSIYIFNTNQVIQISLKNGQQSTIKKESTIAFINSIKSPISGRVIKIHIDAGSSVKTGTPLVTIESMKMENEIRAPFNLFVKSISIAQGHLVKKDQVLLEVDPTVTKK